MKQINFIVIGFALLITSCSTDNTVTQLIKERDSLLQLSTQKDSSLITFISLLGDIEKNLANISQKESALRIKSNEELKGNVTAEINDNIKAINELMDKNAVKIGDLNARLAASGQKVKELETVVEALSASLYQKNSDLGALNKYLISKNKEIVEIRSTAFGLAHQNYKDSETIKQQNVKLNTAYYIFANHQQLKDKNIINKEGKLSDLFKDEQLNQNLTNEFFKEIDIHQKTFIPPGWRMVTKTVKFYTAHPDNSYKLIRDKNNNITNFEITDPENFWKISKFLVIEVD